jgi:hypothetical protein
LDRRYARRGALALVRDVPQIGVAALTLLLVVAAVFIASRSGSSTPTDAGPALDLPAVSGPRGFTVGPIAGSVADYLAGARADLLAHASQAPTEQTFAIADFEKGLTPEEAAASVPGVEVKQIFLRIRAGGTTTFFPSTNVDFATAILKRPLQVQGLPNGAHVVYEGVAAGLIQQAKDNEEFIRSIDQLAVPSQDDLDQKASQTLDARRFRAAAGALRTRCACIYAVVIKGEAQTLANIANSGKVRVVHAALTGVPYERLTWVPLSPDLKDGDQYRPAGK